MKRAVAVWICASAMMLASGKARSQNPSISVNVLPPYTGDLSVWRSDPNRVLIVLTGGGTPATVRISGYAANSDNSLRIETKDNFPVARIDLGAHEVRTLNGRNLSLTDPSSVRYIGTNASTIARSGQLPEGNYRLCLQLLDYANPKNVLSSESCSNFTVTSLDPPRLVSPACDQLYVARPRESITFSWILPGSAAPLESRLQIIDVPRGQNAASLFATNSFIPVYDQTFNGQTSHVYGSSDPPLQAGHTYGWRVQAGSPTHAVTIHNNGYSDVCSFQIESPVICNSPAVSIAYPPSGARIPYRALPLFVRFDPYCEYSHFHSVSTLEHFAARTIDLQWVSGPRVDAGTREWLTREQSQYININNNGESLRPGADLIWNAATTLTIAGNDVAGNITGHFSVGLGPSVPHTPGNDTTLAPGEITLNWETSERPSDSVILPPLDIMRSARPGHFSAFTLAVSERWMLEVSHSPSFSTNLVHFAYGLIGSGVNASQSAAQISQSVFHSIDDRYRYNDTGNYYWRIKWLIHTDPAANDTSAYAWSPAYHFEIRGEIRRTVCFTITPLDPENDAHIRTAQPRFLFRALPNINRSAVTGGRLQIWKMDTSSQDHSDVTGHDPIFNEHFTGNSWIEHLEADDSGVFRFALVNAESGGTSSSNSFHAARDSSYLWRTTIEFIGDTIRSDRYPCLGTNIVSSDGVFTYGSEHEEASPTASDCHDYCSAPLPTDMHPSSATFNSRQVLHLGKFLLHLTEVHGTGLSLSGTGWIPIDFLHYIHIAVAFEGISVNANSEVLHGIVHAVWGGTSMLPDLSGDSGRLGLSQEQIRDIQRVAGQPTRLLTQLVMGDPITLPIGIDTLVGGERLVIGVISMEFSPRNGQLDAAISIPMPMLGTDIGIGLGARNICFSPKGLGDDGRATLYMPSDFGYRDNDEHNWGFVFKGPTMDGRSMTDSGTYVTWGCHGFEKLRIASQVVFPRTWLVPIDSAGQIIPHDKVSATFTAMIEQSYLSAHHSSWGWMATGTMNSRFAVPDAPDYVFDANMIAIDQSDNENPPGMIFPDGYAETGTTWRGFYIGTLMLSLPSQFRTFETGRPIQFAMNNLLIDHSGFSASFRANNLASVSYGGWRGTIDTIGIDFISSRLADGFLDGRILTPLSSTNWLHYRATISHTTGGAQFVFNINAARAIQSDLWAARLTLDPTTRLELRVGGGTGFTALLLMSGTLSIAGDLNPPSGGSGMPGMNLNRIRFQNIALSTQSPYLGCADEHGVIHSSTGHCIEGPVFGMGSGSGSESATEQPSASGFPLSVGEIALHTDLSDMNHLKFGIGFNATLHFQSGANGVGGGTTLTVWARLDHPLASPSFSLDGVSLDAINLDVEVGSTVRIAGRVDFYGNNDPIFGNGFRGHVRASFFEKVTAEATVQFGSKMRSPSDLDPFRYWYVDAMVYLPTGIPFMTGLAFYGFGGGAWYNMDFDRTVREPAPPAGPVGSSTAAEVPPGYTASGYRFIPAEPSGTDNAFGFRAKVAIGTYGSDEVFNADITLSVQFIHGGIESLLLEGDGFLLAGIHNRDNAIATVHVMTEYRFVAQTLDMNMSVALRSPYNNFVQLLSADHAMQFHVDPHRWFFRAGTPTDPTGLQVVNLLTVRTYLMAGNDVLPPGPLPEEIRSRLGDLAVVRTSEMRNGDGCAFGGLIDLRTPRMEIFPVWGQFQVMLGFDFALLHQQPASTCIGSSTPIGANGWYGMGRAFVFLHGGVGLVNPFGRNDDERHPVLADMEAAASVGAGTPNPTWAAGNFEGRFYACGGHVQFHGQFRVGEECHPTPRPRENPLAGLELISEITPRDGSHEVSVGITPQAVFDYQIDRRFEVNETADDGTSRVHAYRIRIRDFSLALHSDRGEVNLPGTYLVNEDNLHAGFTANSGLAWSSTFTAHITAYAEELSGGSWSAAHLLNGNPIEGAMQSTFTTGDAPDTITQNDVAFSYPLDRQRYFLQGESRTGAIQLLGANPHLFNNVSPQTGNQLTYAVRFLHATGGGVLESPATYRAAANRIEFQIPQLDHNTVYAVQLIRQGSRHGGGAAPPGAGGGKNSSEGNSAKNFNPLGSSGRTLVGGRVGAGEKLLYYYYFRTSRFDRMQEKLDAFETLPIEYPGHFGNLEIIGVRFRTAEPFDTYDMNGYHSASGATTFAPLIQLNANSRTSSWHTGFANPQIYDALNRLHTMHLWSGTTDFQRYVTNSANPGDHAGSMLAVYASEPDPPLGDDELLTANRRSSSAQTIRINYLHGIVAPMDYGRLRSTVASIISSYGSDPFTSEENQFFRSVLAGRYQMLSHTDYPLGFSYGYGGQKQVINKGFRY